MMTTPQSARDEIPSSNDQQKFDRLKTEGEATQARRAHMKAVYEEKTAEATRRNDMYNGLDTVKDDPKKTKEEEKEEALAKAKTIFVNEAVVEIPLDKVKEKVGMVEEARVAVKELDRLRNADEAAAMAEWPMNAADEEEQRRIMALEHAECMGRLHKYLMSTEPRISFPKPSAAQKQQAKLDRLKEASEEAVAMVEWPVLLSIDEVADERESINEEEEEVEATT